jgi:ornithine carbamoyltransferase
MNLKGRDFLTLLDYTPEEIAYLVDLAAELKAKKKAGCPHHAATLPCCALQNL